MTEGKVIPVEIHGQRYPIRSGLDPEYVARLAAYVDEKMRTAADSTATGDTLRLAVLAALNIADELETLRQRHESLAGSLSLSQVTMRSRAGSLAGMLDEILDDRKVG